MQNIISSIAIQFGLNNAQLQQELKNTDQIFANWRDGFLRQIVAPIAAALSVGTLFSDFYKQSLELGKVSENTKVAIQDLQAYGSALREVGGDVDDFTQTINNLWHQQEALHTPNGEHGFFTALGIDPHWAREANPIDLLMELTRAFEVYDKTTARMQLRKIGIDESTIKMLERGRSEFQKLAEEQAKMTSITQKDFENMREFQKATKNLRQELQGLANAAFRPLIPILAEFAEKLQQGLRFLKEHPPLLYSLLGILTALSGVMSVKLASNIASVALSLMTKLVPALGATSAAAAPLSLAILPVVAAIVALAFALDDLYTYATGGNAAFGWLWKFLGTPEEITGWVASAKSGISEFVNYASDVAAGGAEAFKKYYSDAGEDIGTFFKSLMVAIRGIFTGNVETFIEGISGMFYAFGKGIYDMCLGIFKNLSDVAIEIWNRITGQIEEGEKTGETEDNFSTDLLNPSRLGRGKSDAKPVVDDDFLKPSDVKAKEERAAALVASVRNKRTQTPGNEQVEGTRTDTGETDKRPEVYAIPKKDPNKPTETQPGITLESTRRAATPIIGTGAPQTETNALLGSLILGARSDRQMNTTAAATTAPLETALMQDMRQTNVTIGKIDIMTQATDAEGISRDLGDTLREKFGFFTGLVDRSMTGTIEKGGVGF